MRAADVAAVSAEVTEEGSVLTALILTTVRLTVSLVLSLSGNHRTYGAAGIREHDNPPDIRPLFRGVPIVASNGKSLFAGEVA